MDKIELVVNGRIVREVSAKDVEQTMKLAGDHAGEYMMAAVINSLTAMKLGIESLLHRHVCNLLAEISQYADTLGGRENDDTRNH